MGKLEDKYVLEVWDSFLPDDMWEHLLEFNDIIPWQDHDGGFLYSDTTGYEFFNTYCVNRINERHEDNHKIHRSYRNGMTTHTEAANHYDMHNIADRTAIFYGHPEWDTEQWGGETTVGEPIHTWIKAVPNRLVLLSAKHNRHYGYAPQPTCDTLRITYVWKLITI